MYCPKCSQQQPSDEVRFCSRCGFQLGVVKELLAQTEAPAQAAAVEPLQPARGLRKRDVTVGALLMLVVALVVVLFPDTTPPPVRDGQLVLTIALFLVLVLFINFVGHLLRAVNKIFGEDEAAPRRGQLSQPQTPAPDLSTKVSAGGRDRAALPPARSVPAASFNPPRVNTAEMLQPPSITEHTTSLLGDKRTSGAL
ncbi:MAG TPA: zinc ribbon domain-containing protein [Pyrinomonadaceae bacterium]|nr:zinc ribbon domain-containing protein [Pyrinomonadaceae bacterium]